MTAGSAQFQGRRIMRLAWWGTGVFVATAVAGALSEGVLRSVAAVVAFVLFAVGIVLFFAAYARAVSRSRFDAVNVGGVYLLLGTAPGAVQLRLLGALALQLVVAVATAAATASVRPFTPLAFGLLVPMFGLACCGLWGAYHGAFPARTDPRASLPADD
jgi:hypothetical protein